MLNKAGFVFEPFGEDTIKLTEVPEICAEMETKELFMEILKEINSIVDNKIEKVFSKKGIFTFNNLTLGNGVVLNCAYQTIDYTYGIENLNNLDDKYYDGKLKYL